MSTADGSGPETAEDVVPFPTISRDAPIHRDLVRVLTEVRNRTGDRAMREAIDDVRRGRTTMRDLIRTPVFGQAMRAAAERSRAELAAMSEDERARLRDPVAETRRSGEGSVQ